MFPKGMEEQYPFGHPSHVPRGRGALVPMQEVQTPITGKPYYLPGITFQGDDVLNMTMKRMTEAAYEQSLKDAEKQAEIDELNRLMALPPEYYMQYSYKKGGVLKGQDGLSTLFARPDGKDNKYLKQSEGLGKGHFINTLGRIYQQERLGTQFGDQYADALGKRTVHTPNIKINNRFNDFRSDEVDRTGSKYLTQINQFKTADSGLNAATRMAGEDQ
jgi:hypothetical protein